MTFKLIIASAVSTLISYIIGIYMIPWLRDKKKAGQKIKKIGELGICRKPEHRLWAACSLLLQRL